MSERIVGRDFWKRHLDHIGEADPADVEAARRIITSMCDEPQLILAALGIGET